MNRAARQRVRIFIVLMALGLCYVGVFTFFLGKSTNFLQRAGLEVAVAQAGKNKFELPYRETIAAGKSSLFLLGPGWHPAESWGVWSSGRRAWLIVPLPANFTGKLDFELQITAFLHAEYHPKQTMRILCGQTELAVSEFKVQEPSKVVEFNLDPADCQNGGTVTFELDIADPASPASLGIGQDARTLGIALQSIAITPVATK